MNTKTLARLHVEARQNIGQLASTVNTLAGFQKVRAEDFAEPLEKAAAISAELLAALAPFAMHVEAVTAAFPTDCVARGDVCRGSVSFNDFQRAADAINSATGVK